MAETSTVHVGEYTEGHLLKLAKTLVKEKTAKTRLFDDDPTASVEKLQTSQLDIGRVLGRGGFCMVNQVTIKDEASAKKEEKDSSYAMKHVSKDAARDDVDTYVNGIVDLAMEAKFLAALQHPNIISLRGISAGEPCSQSFFVVLDRLYDILTVRLLTWKKHKPSGMKKMMLGGGNCKKQKAFWLERVNVAHDVASALAYLHSRHVMHRDLKPDDIGIDVRGDVKLFDFGLAKEYDPAKADKNGCYNMTGCTGSPRYMAPEVALGKPYNQTIDVYSFGLLLYQILALEAPYEGLTMKSFPKIVYEKGARPVPDPKWPAEISAVLQRCWAARIRNRTSMAEVTSVLAKEIDANVL